MDYYPAGSLDAILESRACRRKDARQASRLVGAQLAAALARVHDLRVVHRDVKPSNVLVDGRGRVFLSDFGLATRVARKGASLKKRSFAGTVNYAAPELLLKSHETFDAAVDCWALGCLLYEMLEGDPPFARPSARETFAKIAGGIVSWGRAEVVFGAITSFAGDNMAPICTDRISNCCRRMFKT